MDAWIKAGADINQTDYDGRTALHIAVTTRNEEMIEYLLRNGANINAIDRFGNTPLSFAENSEWESIVKLLKQKQRNRKENYVRFSVDC
ncbi:unnamed protein product [Dracunculus medinensis]|uniref:ANK_REP_REGION domain-containing protein n=1 Tax=Dracunculus medinensis TaxID=318479 RepID=A0A0N4U3R1_DRAME|nr:unnamed protein product [Dracunculus medinensis]